MFWFFHFQILPYLLSFLVAPSQKKKKKEENSLYSFILPPLHHIFSHCSDIGTLGATVCRAVHLFVQTVLLEQMSFWSFSRPLVSVTSSKLDNHQNSSCIFCCYGSAGLVPSRAQEGYGWSCIGGNQRTMLNADLLGGSWVGQPWPLSVPCPFRWGAGPALPHWPPCVGQQQGGESGVSTPVEPALPWPHNPWASHLNLPSGSTLL